MPSIINPRRNPAPQIVIATLAFCGIVVSLMQTLIIPLIPGLPTMLNTTSANASWAITATLLAGAVVTPIGGRLGDMFGKRRILIVSLFAMVVGSVLCALTDSLAIMVTGRALQGLAMGAIPLGISIMRDLLPPQRVGAAVATMSATMGVGGAVGLPLAAFIAQSSDWHMLFWAAAALGAACLALVWFVLPESTVRTPAKFDSIGALGLAVGLSALLIPVTKGSDWGWGSLSTIGLFGFSVITLLAWGAYELRIKAPLVDLRVSARPQVLFTNMASIMIGFAMYGMSLVFPQLLMAPSATGYGLGQSMLMTGLALAPGGLVMMALSPVSARLSARRGPKTTLITGAIVICAGYVLVLFLNAQVWQVILSSMVISAGIGLAFAAMPALIMGAVPITETGAANGLNSLMRAIGTSSSAAVLSVVLASMTMSVGPVSVPTFDAFRVTFAIAVGAAALAGLLAAFVPSRASDTPSTTGPTQDARVSVSAG
ncbi:membrane transport protein [Arthrobacter sp. PAMC 25486]|uniref:MFS transporter n=1 Tax=Arthrobacter sp. PAMC 25486 TaxID=1494608 RepID=UPI000535E77B|nr:MFS transporter [Arthrobacter sp. PAMC 25486]AIY02237.1 membrane transport protein [Arthrobacter sp. PAMC 25486]